jgi:hypothetical protein
LPTSEQKEGVFMVDSFELEHTELVARERLAQGNVMLSHEITDRLEIEETAQYLIVNHETVTEIPIEDEHLNNGTTGLFEKITASGHLSHIEFEGDQEIVHVATLQRLLNGYMINDNPWDKRRNFEEICEELFIYRGFKKIESGELPADTLFLTSSDSPDETVADQEKVDQGYRMLNNKGMLRSHHFEKDEEGNWTRVLEQVSRSNSNDKSTRRWCNSNAASVPLSATGGLSMQVVTSRQRLPDGVITWQSELDAVFGTDRFCGEPINEVQDDRYATLRENSAGRENKLEKQSSMLADFDNKLKVRQLAGEITYKDRLSEFYKYIDDVLTRRIVLNSPQYAKDTYGEVAGAHYEQAAYFIQQGDIQQAKIHMHLGERTTLKEASVGCGGSGSKSNDTEPDSIGSLIDTAIEGAIEDKNDWTWTEGVYQVESCDTRPGKTKVGPCSVCKGCQHVFDKGGDPTLVRASKKTAESQSSIDIIFEGIIASIKVKKEEQKVLKDVELRKLDNEQFAAAA